ncbi:MAG: 6-carboxytetrahydropterin synthase [Acidobacteria bacterium]|nr:6-carboxytetrahydropterin synthase [Acidobacteriota bacterium]
MGTFRVAKTFEVEYAHRLSKHPEKCRFPHGHRLKIEIVVRASRLDANDMVCDYKALKGLAAGLIDELDHAMALNAADPHRPALEAMSSRVVLFEGQDPTAEALARRLFDLISAHLAANREIVTSSGARYAVPPGVELERVRVWETASSWAEYTADEV